MNDFKIITMKSSRKYSFLAVLILIFSGLISCGPKQDEGPDMGNPPTENDLSFEITPVNNPNILSFTNTSKVAGIALWEISKEGEPAQAGKGQSIKQIFPYKGDYSVTLTLFAKGGSAKKTKTFSIADDNLSLLCDNETFNLLTGGCGVAEGKTWLWNKTVAGHFGVGPADSYEPIWWSAGPLDKEGVGMYDDKMTFKIDGLSYSYENNGDTYVNKEFWADFGLTSQPNEDFTAAYTPPQNMTWNISESGGKKFLSISKNGFLSYYYGVPVIYEIVELSEDEMFLISRHSSISWFYRFIREGFEPPPPPPPIDKPIASKDIFDTFDEPGTMKWFFEGGTDGTFSEMYDNPEPTGINFSKKVAQYSRGTTFQYTNTQFELDYRIDLTTRNVFKVKVYFVSNPEITAQNTTVSIKLQNSLLGGNAWTTQVEKKVTITEKYKWVEAIFDFSDAQTITRKDFDKIVLQFGGEGHLKPGTFYFDDFELAGGPGGGLYDLIWQEDFNYTGAPSSEFWSYDIGIGNNGWGNNESQFYTERPENSKVENGVLKITALKEIYGGKSYTSARIKTQNKFSFQKGLVEIRAKMPGGNGIWPALWMLGDNFASSGWPACGEIDIAEYRGKEPNVIHGSTHTPSSYGNTINTGTKTVPSVETEFHIYSMEWDAENIRFMVDNQLFYTYNPGAYNANTWPFNQSMFLILNVAVGGTFGGAIDDGIFPQTMEVDYIKVYQKKIR